MRPSFRPPPPAAPQGRRARAAGPALALAAAALLAQQAGAADLRVAVQDEHGQALPNAVLVAEPRTGAAAPVPAAPGVAHIAQRDEAFVPEVLVIPPGTRVEFPNDDPVMHHVYSFSPAKTFELHLYGRAEVPHVVFDQEGIVALGCNIHDRMRGYVYVTSKPYATVSAADGSAVLRGLPPGAYALEVWHPRQRAAQQAMLVEVGEQMAAELRVSLAVPGTRLGALDRFERSGYR